jgi:hypothetical protein
MSPKLLIKKQDEQEGLAQGYEDYREIVDYVILNRVEY